MKPAGVLLLTALTLLGQGEKKVPPGSFDNSRGAKPDALHSVGVRGSVDAGGYAASATAKTQTGLFRELAELQVAALRPTIMNWADCSASGKIRNNALASLMKGDAAAAASQMEAAPKVDDVPESRQLLGFAYEALGRLEAAAQQFVAAADVKRTSSSYFAAGVAVLLVGDADRASEIFSKANNALGQTGSGAAQFQSGRVAEAVRTFLAAAAKSKEQSEAFSLLTVALPAADPDTVSHAARQLSSVVVQKPLVAEAHLAYATALALSAQDQKAAAELEVRRAIRLDPQVSQAYVQLGSLLATKGALTAASDAYRQALQLDNSLTDVHYRLSQIYVRSGEPQKGREQLKLHARFRDLQRADIDAGRVPIRFRGDPESGVRVACK